MKTSASKSEASQTEISDLSSEMPTSLLLGTARLRQRGNEWDGYVAKGCTRALKTTRATDRSVYRNWWKNRQDPHILCVQLSFLWSAMLSRALASVASPNSPGAGLFTVFNNPCTNPKISFSQLPALLSLSCEISDATNSDKQFAFRQCSLTTKLKYSYQMFL